MGQHTATHCHCGCDRNGSDHCPECGCEEFESVCSHVSASAMRIVLVDSPYDREGGYWAVVAPWYGQERTVYLGTIWECIRFKVDAKEA